MKHLPTLLLADYVATVCLGILLSGLMLGPVDPENYLSARSVLSQVVVMPFLETAIFQLAVIESVMRILSPLRERNRMIMACILSAFLFFLSHYLLNSKFNGLVFGLSGGIIFALMYGLNRKDGAQRAFFWTWILHLLANLLLMGSYAFFIRTT